MGHILFIAAIREIGNKYRSRAASSMTTGWRIVRDGGIYENSIHGKWGRMLAHIGLLLPPLLLLLLLLLVNGMYISAACTCELRKYIYDTCCTCDIRRRVCDTTSLCDPVSRNPARFSYGSVLFSREHKHPVSRIKCLHVGSWQAISGSSLPLSVFHRYPVCRWNKK